MVSIHKLLSKEVISEAFQGVGLFETVPLPIAGEQQELMRHMASTYLLAQIILRLSWTMERYGHLDVGKEGGLVWEIIKQNELLSSSVA